MLVQSQLLFKGINISNMKSLSEYINESTTGVDAELAIGQNLTINDFKKKRPQASYNWKAQRQFVWKCPTLLANENATGLVFDYVIQKDDSHNLRISVVKGSKELSHTYFAPDEKIIHGVIDLIRKVALDEKSFAEFIEKLNSCDNHQEEYPIDRLN